MISCEKKNENIVMNQEEKEKTRSFLYYKDEIKKIVEENDNCYFPDQLQKEIYNKLYGSWSIVPLEIAEKAPRAGNYAFAAEYDFSWGKGKYVNESVFLLEFGRKPPIVSMGDLGFDEQIGYIEILDESLFRIHYFTVTEDSKLRGKGYYEIKINEEGNIVFTGKSFDSGYSLGTVFYKISGPDM